MDPFGAQSLNGDGTAAPDVLRAGETALTSVDLSQATQALSEARLPGAEDLASGSLSQAQSVLDNTSDPRAKEPRTNYRTETDGDERRQETRSPQSTSQRATGQHQTSSPQRSRASKEPENTQKRNSSSSPSKQSDGGYAEQQGEDNRKSVDDQIKAGKDRLDAAEKKKQQAEQSIESAQGQYEAAKDLAEAKKQEAEEGFEEAKNLAERKKQEAEEGVELAKDVKKKINQGHGAVPDADALEEEARKKAEEAKKKAANCLKNPFKEYKNKAQAFVYKFSVGVLTFLLALALLLGMALPMGWIEVPSFDYVLLLVFVAMTLLELLRERLAYLTDNNLNYQKLPARQFLCQPRSIVMSFLWIPAAFTTGDRPTIYRVCAETLVSGAVLVASLANEEFFFGPEGIPEDYWENEPSGVVLENGEEVCERNRFAIYPQEMCENIGCCQWDEQDQACFSAVGTGACEVNQDDWTLPNGEVVCEDNGFDQNICESVGCCQWDPQDQACFSAVGPGTCEITSDAAIANGAPPEIWGLSRPEELSDDAPSGVVLNGAEVCQGNRFAIYPQEMCENIGCCIWDQEDQDCYSADATGACEVNQDGWTLPNGEVVCGANGFDQNICESVGCCQWDPQDQACLSAVGPGTCEITSDAAMANGAPPEIWGTLRRYAPSQASRSLFQYDYEYGPNSPSDSYGAGRGDAPTGRDICEGYYWQQDQCGGIGCCEWNLENENQGYCVSAVGDGECSLDVSGEFACEQVEQWDEETCNYIGCCQWDEGRCWSAVGQGTCSTFNRLFNDEFNCEALDKGYYSYFAESYSDYYEYVQDYCGTWRNADEPSRDPILMGSILVGLMGTAMIIAAYLCFRGTILTEVQPKNPAQKKQSKRWAQLSKIFVCLQGAAEGADAAHDSGDADDADDDDDYDTPGGGVASDIGDKVDGHLGGGKGKGKGKDEDEDDDDDDEDEEEEEKKKKKKKKKKKGKNKGKGEDKGKEKGKKDGRAEDDDSDDEYDDDSDDDETDDDEFEDDDDDDKKGKKKKKRGGWLPSSLDPNELAEQVKERAMERGQEMAEKQKEKAQAKAEKVKASAEKKAQKAKSDVEKNAQARVQKAEDGSQRHITEQHIHTNYDEIQSPWSWQALLAPVFGLGAAIAAAILYWVLNGKPPEAEAGDAAEAVERSNSGPSLPGQDQGEKMAKKQLNAALRQVAGVLMVLGWTAAAETALGCYTNLVLRARADKVKQELAKKNDQKTKHLELTAEEMAELHEEVEKIKHTAPPGLPDGFLQAVTFQLPLFTAVTIIFALTAKLAIAARGALISFAPSVGKEAFAVEALLIVVIIVFFYWISAQIQIKYPGLRCSPDGVTPDLEEPEPEPEPEPIPRELTPQPPEPEPCQDCMNLERGLVVARNKLGVLEEEYRREYDELHHCWIHNPTSGRSGEQHVIDDCMGTFLLTTTIDYPQSTKYMFDCTVEQRQNSLLLSPRSNPRSSLPRSPLSPESPVGNFNTLPWPSSPGPNPPGGLPSPSASGAPPAPSRTYLPGLTPPRKVAVQLELKRDPCGCRNCAPRECSDCNRKMDEFVDIRDRFNRLKDVLTTHWYEFQSANGHIEQPRSLTSPGRNSQPRSGGPRSGGAADLVFMSGPGSGR